MLFLSGQIGFAPWEQLQKNLWFLDKYLFVVLAFVYVQTIENVSKYYPLFFKVFEVFIIINSICIVLGLFLPTDWFNTYYGTAKRFGLNGTILRSGASTYIYWIALFYYACECFVLKKKKYLPFGLVFIASLLLGTKAIFISYIFLGFFIFILLRGHKNKWVLISAIVVALSGFVFFDNLLHWLVAQSPSLQKVYDERGIWSVVFSLRDQHLLEEMLPLIQEKWTWRNYLFGGGYDMHFRSQFGLLDLFYFFGIIGMAAYLFIFAKLFCSFKINNITSLFLLGTFVLMAFSANFFYETILAFHLVFAKSYFERIDP
ncbi:hypothetical protein [Rasiella sp. SM2506]|uniref:hypothetical protein n=1 Tax=Rasiella sp. SM2506 TaxID=3423914 RepID=UPI003D79B5BF